MGWVGSGENTLDYSQLQRALGFFLILVALCFEVLS